MKVYMGIPTYNDQPYSGTILAALNAASSGLLGPLRIESFSWLTRNFNTLYADALNNRDKGITHFCLLHSDVLPMRSDWLEKMCDIMTRVGADVLSVIIPFKSESGLTSTAIDEPYEMKPLRRLTMHEVYSDFEPTFTHPKLLINTGLMLVDIRNKWAESMYFQFIDSIIQTNGQFKAIGFPEDWDFSRRAREKGASLWATREIPVFHAGGGKFPNNGPWGTMKTDKAEVT